MKKVISGIVKLSLLFSILIVFTSCEDNSYIRHTYTANTPKTFMSYDDLRSSVDFQQSRSLENPGKIYFKSSYIYINERFKGIHVIDNSDVNSPKNIGFINIPGNVDIAIKGNILYADSYIDLVAIDISGIANGSITVTNRINDMFEYPYYGFNSDYPIATVDKEKGVVIEWEVKEVTEEVESEYYGHWKGWGTNELTSFDAGSGSAWSSPTTSRMNTAGKAGSMAKFMVYSTYLYVINEGNVEVIDISDYQNPKDLNVSVNTGRIIETLFTNNNMLFIGSTTGMIIYSLATPENPTLISTFNHATACDPVVVQDNYAFVTLRSGNACGGFENQVDVVDISNIASPFLVRSYELKGPYGLGVDNDKLFICDGDDGLKVFTDATVPSKMSVKKHFANINAYDVIPLGTILLLIGEDGFYQYDYTDLDNMTLLSVIPVN